MHAFHFFTAEREAETPFFSIVIDNQVSGYAQNPGLETAGLGSEAAEVTIDTDKNLLGKIFSFVPSPRESQAEIENALCMRMNHLPPGICVSPETSLNQYSILIM
jgi:hypothetical protein